MQKNWTGDKFLPEKLDGRQKRPNSPSGNNSFILKVPVKNHKKILKKIPKKIPKKNPKKHPIKIPKKILKKHPKKIPKNSLILIGFRRQTKMIVF